MWLVNEEKIDAPLIYISIFKIKFPNNKYIWSILQKINRIWFYRKNILLDFLFFKVRGKLLTQIFNWNKSNE